jgi:hypothetical protein
LGDALKNDLHRFQLIIFTAAFFVLVALALGHP